MADSTTTNGVVLQLPYAIIRNVTTVRPFTLSVIGVDPLRGVNNSLRAVHTTIKGANNGTFVYVGDVIHFDLQAACNDATANAFDIIQINQSTGVETTQTTARFTQIWQKSLVMTVTAINASTGAVTFTTTYR